MLGSGGASRSVPARQEPISQNLLATPASISTRYIEGKVRIDAAVAQFGDRLVGDAIVVEGYAMSGAPSVQLAMSRSRAALVRNYLHTRFQLDDQNVGAVPLRGVPPPATHKDSWNGICIVLLSQAS